MKKSIVKVAMLVGLIIGFVLPATAQDKATQQLTLTVNPATVSITTASLPNGETSLAYSGVALVATGGVAPYTFSVSNGALPAGIALASSGAFSGTPTATGTASFKVTVSDSESPAATATSSFTILVIAPLTITTTTLPSATVGSAYSASISASGGVAPYTCAITSGSLPAGLALSGCSITGTPTASGAFTITVTVTDSESGTIALLKVTGLIDPSGRE